MFGLGHRTWSSALAGLMLVLLLALLIQHDLRLGERLLPLLEWIDQAGLGGMLVFGGIVVVVVVLVLPGAVLTLSAGFLYGAVHGAAIVVVAETVGAVIAFLLARSVLADRAATLVARYPNVERVIETVVQQGWPLIAVLRMLPFSPFKVSNYAFGLTPVPLPAYFVGTFLGLWPVTLFNTYLGSLANTLLFLESPVWSQTQDLWVWLLLGSVFSIALIMVLVWYIKRILKQLEAPR